MIRHCYESDINHMLQYHITSDLGIEHCIHRTVSDLVLNDVQIFKVILDNKFIGYFGDKQGLELSGFFIMPEFRKTHKKQFWNKVVNHFNGNFKCGVFDKNEPAKKFLIKNGCNLINTIGNGLIFEYMECI